MADDVVRFCGWCREPVTANPHVVITPTGLRDRFFHQECKDKRGDRAAELAAIARVKAAVGKSADEVDEARSNLRIIRGGKANPIAEGFEFADES